MEINYFTVLYWFCHTSTWILHRYTHVPHPEPLSLPIPSPWVVPVHQPWGSSIRHWTWTGNSFLIWYYTCFNAILPNHPSLSLFHRVQKTVLCIGVSFAVWLFLKNVLWVTFLYFGNSNNFLVGCWASLSSPLPGRTSEVNDQNTPRNQGIVLDELNKVVSLGYLHSVQNVFLWWPNDELLFWFSSFSFKTSLIPPCMPNTPPTPYFFSSSYPFWFSFPSICIF